MNQLYTVKQVAPGRRWVVMPIAHYDEWAPGSDLFVGSDAQQIAERTAKWRNDRLEESGYGSDPGTAG